MLGGEAAMGASENGAIIQRFMDLNIAGEIEQASQLLTEEDMAEVVACGPDPDRHLEMIGRFTDAGFDHVYVHQIGPDQDGFIQFAQRELLPRLEDVRGTQATFSGAAAR